MTNEKALFLKKFFQKGRAIASFAPSSKALAAELCRYVDSNQSQIILELGAGTGAVTEFVLNKMHPRSTLIAVESDTDFVDFLKKRCASAKIIDCSAEWMLEPLAKLNIFHVDLILNCLPTPSLSKDVLRAVLQNCFCLMKTKDVLFSQITLMPWVYMHLYKRFFDSVEFKLVMKSIPPGGVYHCQHFKKIV